MKKKAVSLILITAMLTTALTACGRNNTENNKENDTGMANTEGTIDHTGTESQDSTEFQAGTENGTSQLSLGSAVEIPESFDGQLAETDAHERLEQVIAAYCNVPEEEYANVRYYYNYVDLNGDSKDEILALVLGQEVEGIRGNVLLWLDAENQETGADAVWQAFKQVGSPIYISNHVTNGHRDLIIPENINIVAGTEGSGMDTVGGESGNEMVNEVTAIGVTGVGITDEGEGGGTGNTDADTNSQTTTVGTDSQAGEASSELGIPLIPTDQQYRLLVWDGERYQLPEEGTALYSLVGYEGIAILTNNIESDYVNDNYHFLGEAMR